MKRQTQDARRLPRLAALPETRRDTRNVRRSSHNPAIYRARFVPERAVIGEKLGIHLNGVVMDPGDPASYAPDMSTSPLSPHDIRAAAEAHAELGPEYRDAVVESFLAKIDNEISARIDARLGAGRAQRRDTDPVTAARRGGVSAGLARGLALGTVATGLPLTVLVVYLGHRAFAAHWQAALWVIWIGIAIVYGAAAVITRERNKDR